jgi:hypothetical protein
MVGFAMRPLITILALLTFWSSAIVAGALTKPTLSFSLTATNTYFVRSVGQGLRLRVDREELGWEAGVFKTGGHDNLLLPQENWHGVQQCQIYTWMPRTHTFGEVRVIPVRGTKWSVRIRLVGATASGKPGNEKFTGGRADLFFEAL